MTSGIEEAWVISATGFTDAAISHAKSEKHLDLISFSELESRLLDIRPYLQMLIDEYDRSGTEELYVGLRTAEGRSLNDEVKRWI